VSVKDVDGVVHHVEVQAATLFEAGAAAIAAFRQQGWAVDALTPGLGIRVEPASFELAGAGEGNVADTLFADGFDPPRGRSQVIAVTATPPPGGAGPQPTSAPSTSSSRTRASWTARGTPGSGPTSR
jgi:hypothetical protein